MPDRLHDRVTVLGMSSTSTPVFWRPSDSIEPTDELAENVLTGVQVRALIAEKAAGVGLSYDDAISAAAHGALPVGPAGTELAELIYCLRFPVAAAVPAAGTTV
jgi:hypothetical protein